MDKVILASKSRLLSDNLRGRAGLSQPVNPGVWKVQTTRPCTVRAPTVFGVEEGFARVLGSIEQASIGGIVDEVVLASASHGRIRLAAAASLQSRNIHVAM